MSKENFEKAFNKIRNKNINALDESDISFEEKLVCDIVNNFDKHTMSKGAFKICAYLGRNKQFVILKYLDEHIKKCPAQYETNDNVIAFNNWLISHGIKTPKIHTMFYASKNYYEVCNRIKGLELYRHNFKRFAKNNNFKHDIIKDLTSEESKMLGNSEFLYRLHCQEILKKMDISKYEDLFRQYKFLHDIGFRDLDIHGGNLMINKHGFHIIDLDIEDSLHYIIRHLKQLENKDYTIPELIARLDKNPKLPKFYDAESSSEYNPQMVHNIISTFCTNINNYVYKTNKQRNILENNNKIILKKLITSASNLNINLYESQWHAKGLEYYILRSIGGDEEVLKDIMASQKGFKSKPHTR